MKVYFLILGIISLLYYLVLAVYSRRLRSTFAAFWLMNGGVHLFLGCAPFPFWVYQILGWICAAGWIIFLAVEAKIVSAMFLDNDRSNDWIIVLGAQVRGRYITNSLKRRLDCALRYAEQNTGVRIIVSGGQGPEEDITEADAMAEYLVQKGIPEDRIFREDKSASTRENLKFSRKYADAEHDKVGIVTNDFHIFRSLLIARQEGYCDVCGIPADSNPVFQINYLVREFFGVVQVCIKGRKRKK